jgi:hypothetical protein
MQAQRMKIYFEDEAPRIGCGWRIVSVQIGRKWVRVRTQYGSARFTKGQFERLRAQPA